jgi:hypothetical protein
MHLLMVRMSEEDLTACTRSRSSEWARLRQLPRGSDAYASASSRKSLNETGTAALVQITNEKRASQVLRASIRTA